VLLDEYHSGHDFSTFSGFLNELAGHGYRLERNRAPYRTEPTSYSLVWIEGTYWGHPFELDEIYVLRRYVEGGGMLWLSGNGWIWIFYGRTDIIKEHTIENFPLNRLGRVFGVVSNADYYIDDSNTRAKGAVCFFAPEGINDHPVTKGVRTASTEGGVLSTLNVSASVHTILVQGDKDAYSYEAHWLYQTSRKGDKAPVMVAVEHGAGRVLFGNPANLAEGDSDADGIPNLYEYDNLKLGLNAIDWLSGRRIELTDSLAIVMAFPPNRSVVQGFVVLNAMASSSSGRPILSMAYRVDDGGWEPMTLGGNIGIAWWDSTRVQDGEHRIDVHTTDMRGTTAATSLIVVVRNQRTVWDKIAQWFREYGLIVSIIISAMVLFLGTGLVWRFKKPTSRGVVVNRGRLSH